MYSIPLRRALVTQSDLPYPEGVACAEVLKVGGGEHADAAASRTRRAGLARWSGARSFRPCLRCMVATRIFASDLVRYFRVGGERGGVTGFDFFFSFALFGVGHLVGLWVGVAMLVGALIGWAWGVPHYSALSGQHRPLAQTGAAHLEPPGAFRRRRHHSRRGDLDAGQAGEARDTAGCARRSPPRARARAGKPALLPRTERDIPIGYVAVITLGLPGADRRAARELRFAAAASAAHMTLLVIGRILVYIALMSFFVSAVCGYMAGLIGSSNSPLSGIGILAVIGAALLLVFGVRSEPACRRRHALVAYALFVTAVVFAVATIANNNLQDLKTGQLVDATPWKQQVALVIGVIAGAVIIPPILDLLNHAYGFAGRSGPAP